MRNLSVFFPVLTVLVVSCAPSIPRYSFTATQTNVKVVTQQFKIKDKEKNYHGNIDFGAQIARNLSMILQKHTISSCFAGDSNCINEGDYVITGIVTKIDEGSWVLRFLFGFTGMAHFASKAILTDPKTKVVISEFENERLSSSYLGSDNILQRLCLEISEDIENQFRKEISMNNKESLGITEKP